MEDALSEILHHVIEKEFSQEKMMLFLVKEKIKEYGIKLTKNQERVLISHLQKQGLEGLAGFTFEPNRNQKAILKKSGREDLVIELDFQQSDLDALQNKISHVVSRASIGTTEWLSDKLNRAWMKQSKSILKRIKSERRQFVDIHNKIWGKPLDLLDAFISLSTELGSEFSQKHNSSTPNDQGIVFLCLNKVACQRLSSEFRDIDFIKRWLCRWSACSVENTSRNLCNCSICIYK